jgi:hypothetical protein
MELRMCRFLNWQKQGTVLTGLLAVAKFANLFVHDAAGPQAMHLVGVHHPQLI